MQNHVKITEDQVREIRKSYAIYREIGDEIKELKVELNKLINERKQYQPKTLAKNYGLSDRYVLRVAVGDNWPNVV